ncbi:universal stress protein [Leptobacterium flavescens]|uniref:Universal stress protein n=1 Tax=Leptobacterium flavescens TaxID=472055 RepID=A0A6P0UPC2_9FLAO|nr:universal stress protein [Leptobacterium flavescens]NER14300.1 universal stress protein [Leptobacterium flavescens]
MKNILVPIAASTNVESTLQYAIDFAEHFKAKVYVLGDFNVVSRAGSIIRIDEIIERETKAHVNEIVSGVDRKKVEVATVTAKGNLQDILEDVSNELNIDLVMIESNNAIASDVFLDNISGGIIKQMEIPTLIVPHGYEFSAPRTILTAFKSGILKRKKVLRPLRSVVETFKAKVNLLLVKTPKFKEEDLVVNPKLQAMGELTTTENATTFQGVLEHFQSSKPDMLCVFRRKRGFFVKLWEKNVILKKEFHCNIPVLVLIGKM